MDETAPALEHTVDQPRMLTRKRATQHRATRVDDIPNYNEKYHTFEAIVRDYVKHDSGNYKVMEGIVKSRYMVRSQTAKRGLARSHAAVVSGEIAGYETAQERPRELENKLYFALRDGTVLLAWIIEN